MGKWKSLPQQERVNHILEAWAQMNDLIHTAAGYAHGMTEKRDGSPNPFILIYAPWDGYNGHLLRVYQDRFRFLPPFVETDLANWHPRATDTSIGKDQAMKKGIFVDTPRFVILRYEGADTSMGPTRRFQATLSYETEGAQPAGNSNGAQEPTRARSPQPAAPPKKQSPALTHRVESGWKYECQDGAEVGEAYQTLFRSFVTSTTLFPTDLDNFKGWITRNRYCMDGSQVDPKNNAHKDGYDCFVDTYGRPAKTVESLSEYCVQYRAAINEWVLAPKEGQG